MVDYAGKDSSVTGKSKAIMAIWGQNPGFDSRTRWWFERWTHLPDPAKLPHLKIHERYYTASQYADMLIALNGWILKWPNNNNSKYFSSSFKDLCPGIPAGRLIDMIYNQEIPDS